MGVQKSGRQSARSRQVEGPSNISALSGGARISRASLLAGASLVALGALAAPDRALAACSGHNQTISTSRTGPVLSDGGAITVTTSGSVTGSSGVTGSDGVDVTSSPAKTIDNSGTITGGRASVPPFPYPEFFRRLRSQRKETRTASEISLTCAANRRFEV
jgi:hypothetical protein